MVYKKRQLDYSMSLAHLRPDIASQWHPTLNDSKAPSQYRVSSGIKAWWLCDKRHEWETTIDKRTLRGDKCPYCSNKKILKGFNDLLTTHPDIASQWHPTKNLPLNPELVTPGSNRSAWWKCDKGHEWENKIVKRTMRGDNCPYCSNQKVIPGFNDLLTTHPDIASQWHPTKNHSLAPNLVSAGADYKIWWVCDKGHEWETFLYNRKAGHSCFQCSKGNTSLQEKVLQDFVKKIEPETQTNVRGILPKSKRELDIYIPSKKIAIEFNGVYWHSEITGKDKNYHYDKWLACQKAGIQLIQIWEDDWSSNPTLIERMIVRKLGLSKEVSIYGRKTYVQEISYPVARDFLNKNHIQKSKNGSYYLGLFTKEDANLIAVMVLRKTKNIFEISRYSTSKPVVGGFTKLLKYVEDFYKPDAIITFSDNSISNGELYSNNGFHQESNLPPDYMYVRGRVREHKFNYRIKRFKTDNMLKYAEGLTERELAQLNKIPRVWDSGKIKWIKQYV